jgi:hypothetical protein
MKLSTLTTKLTSLKSRTFKILAATALAGAALTAAVPAAQAQRVVVGVGFGGPRYYAPPPPVVYGGYGYYHHDWRYGHPYHRYGWYR